MRYDCIVIGSGPAGLSAAINLKLYNKNILIFGNERLSDKIWKAEQVNNYPGMYQVTGAKLAEAFIAHKDAMGITITDKIVSNIYDMGGYYTVMAENEFYETESVILAIGVVPTKQYDGEAEFLGRGVSYCATCDGVLYKEKTIAVVATAKRFETEICYLADLAKKVYVFPFYKDYGLDAPNVEIVQGAIKQISGAMKVDKLILADRSIDVDGVFILRNAIAPTTLLAGLAIEDGHVIVNRIQETNLAGVYAIGDCTGKPYQYAKAIGEGNVAAHSVIEYLGEK